jgi:hypothetical protein
MVPEFDPVRPVHPAWPGRRVLEEGDELKRQRPSPENRGERDRADDQAGGQEPGEYADRRRDPPASDGAGQHVDDYA